MHAATDVIRTITITQRTHGALVAHIDHETRLPPHRKRTQHGILCQKHGRHIVRLEHQLHHLLPYRACIVTRLCQHHRVLFRIQPHLPLEHILTQRLCVWGGANREQVSNRSQSVTSSSQSVSPSVRQSVNPSIRQPDNQPINQPTSSPSKNVPPPRPSPQRPRPGTARRPPYALSASPTRAGPS